MAIYELRTYDVVVGKMSELVKLYTEAWSGAGTKADKLVGYFIGDIGALNQFVHLWKFDDDADRRAYWGRVYADPDAQAFFARVRPLIAHQSNKLLMSAPWGPQP